MPDDETPVSVPTLDDETISALAKELGIAGDEGGDEPSGEGDPSQVGRKAEGEEPKTPASDGLELPKPPTGQALVDLLRDDKEAQAAIQRGLDSWLQTASAEADAKKEQEEFRKLVADGDFEAIGKRYVEGLSEKAIREKTEVEVYGQVYQALLSQPELLDAKLTAEEKLKLDHTQYDSDDQYIGVLTNFIAEKRAGSAVEDRVTKALNERIETLKNMKTQQTVSDPSISTLPGGSPHSRGDEKQSSSSLISAGFKEMFENEAERVGSEVA